MWKDMRRRSISVWNQVSFSPIYRAAVGRAYVWLIWSPVKSPASSSKIIAALVHRRPSTPMFPTVMDETEKMLKTAYAEMILNTSKEAAARVMAAEWKAHKFEQDLVSAKEEALRILHRMKQMIDSKSREAEITSLNEKRRIDELEAQLDEAEGLIIDLRAKLSQVQDQLEDEKSKHMHSLRQPEKVVMPNQNMIYENEQYFSAPFKSFSELESKTLTSEALGSTSEHSIWDHKCFITEKEKETATPEAELSHKSKESDLSRDGCTQRLHAFETGLVDGKLHSTDEIISLHENPTIERNGQNEVVNSMPVPRTDESSELDFSMKQAAFLKDNPANDQPAKLYKKCRRRNHYSKTKAILRKYRSRQVLKRRRTPFSIFHCKSHSHISSGNHGPGCFSTNSRHINEVDYTCGEAKGHLAIHQTFSVISRSVRKRKIRNRDGFATSCRLNVGDSGRCNEPCQPDETVRFDKKMCKDMLEAEDGGKDICIGATPANFNTSMDTVQGSSFLGDVAVKDSRVIIDKSIPEKQDELASDLELENRSCILSDSKYHKTSEMTDKPPSQPDSKMPPKNTFFRKRKGALMNPAGINSFQQSSTKKRSGVETDKVLAPEKQDGLASDLELENISCVLSDSKDNKTSEMTNKPPRHPDSKMPHKYTFFRKRKGALMNPAGINSFQQSTTKKRSGVETDKVLAPEKQDGLASDLELENISYVLSDSKYNKTSEMTDKPPSQPDSKMPPKYTFFRKRKGALMNPAGINSFQQSSTKKRSGVETDEVLAPEKQDGLASDLELENRSCILSDSKYHKTSEMTDKPPSQPDSKMPPKYTFFRKRKGALMNPAGMNSFHQSSTKKRSGVETDKVLAPEKQDGLASDLELENICVLSDSKYNKTSEMTDKPPSQPDSKMPLKYTFFRKRKGALMNPAGINSFQQSSTTKRSGVETDKVLAPEKQDGLASDLELENISCVLSDSKYNKTSEMTDKPPSQPDSKMPLKYAFFRKRKGALMNTAGINSFQQSSTKKRSGVETDKVLVPGSSNSVYESSRDGRQLVQVAHQLISLSGKG